MGRSRCVVHLNVRLIKDGEDYRLCCGASAGIEAATTSSTVLEFFSSDVLKLDWRQWFLDLCFSTARRDR